MTCRYEVNTLLVSLISNRCQLVDWHMQTGVLTCTLRTANIGLRLIDGKQSISVVGPLPKNKYNIGFDFSYLKCMIWKHSDPCSENTTFRWLGGSLPTFFLYRITQFIVSVSFISPTDTLILWRQTRHIINRFPRWSVLRNEFSILRVFFCSSLQTLWQVNAM